ncbi:hypothetical protein [Clostridium aminobutyricum]|uniref:Uncharacterized protein n=1 Tax=Clostridium aminobutyricum TaxID=33953 RepID=A0A939IHR9_CLOAM|nr:hypothetical protein [Clostridium aminobutyricum]MBN7774147.1 hypothetical protein [Clostridium aminobutyricum]
MGVNQNMSQVSSAKDEDIYPYIKKKIIKEMIKSKFEYLSKHAGLAALCVTICVAVISSLAKIFIYAYECGRFDYWGISRFYINVSNENILYDIFFNISLFIFFCAINIPSYSIITAKKKWIQRTRNIVLLLVCTWIFFFLLFSIIELVESHKMIEWDVKSVLYVLWISIFLHLNGIAVGIATIIPPKASEQKQNEIKKNSVSGVFSCKNKLKDIIFFVVVFSIFICSCYGMGALSAQQENSYKIIDNELIVVYEGNDFFLVSEYKIRDTEEGQRVEVNKSVKTEIKKMEVTSRSVRFQEVDFK